MASRPLRAPRDARAQHPRRFVNPNRVPAVTASFNPMSLLGFADRLGFRRRQIATILGLNLGAAVFEGVGLGMFLPVIEYMNSGGDLVALNENSQLWRSLTSGYESIGIPVTLATLLGIAFIALLCRQGFTYARLIYSARVQYGLTRTIRDEAFRRFVHADLAYHDEVRAGSIVNELTTELARATSSLASAIDFTSKALLSAVYLMIMLTLSPPMTLAVMAIIAIAAWQLRTIQHRTRVAGGELTAANQRLSRFLVERVKAIRLIRLAGTEQPETEAMSLLNEGQRAVSVTILRYRALLTVIFEPVVIAAGFILIGVGYAVIGLSVAAIMLFFVILIRLTPIVNECLLLRQIVGSSLPALDLVDRRMAEMAAAVEHRGGKRRFDGLAQEIRLDDVSFAYASKGGVATALKGISLRIPAARRTALVGPSGGGKSTLVDILARLRPPDAGQVLFDGVPHSEFEVQSLRRNIAYAPQSPLIFDVTPAQHIGYGQLGADRERIVAAARLANADDFIRRLPQGYDTPLGEDGAQLSGGQRQRLDLARALVGGCSILILDEPTSNLDADAETLFRQALENIRQRTNTTIIIIGHRLSTVAGADQIVVLEEGRVTEVGTHQALARSGGWYARAFAKQQVQPSDDLFVPAK
jgi:ABC-type multidrug transport system fused ATPase/permease subunit